MVCFRDSMDTLITKTPGITKKVETSDQRQKVQVQEEVQGQQRLLRASQRQVQVKLPAIKRRPVKSRQRVLSASRIKSVRNHPHHQKVHPRKAAGTRLLVDQVRQGKVDQNRHQCCRQMLLTISRYSIP